ncbi:unnamed protein product [Pedinophyceae sp. YPF-701]|nr:unnamed protein product [Pedinophyceae sp. YPF-701]
MAPLYKGKPWTLGPTTQPSRKGSKAKVYTIEATGEVFTDPNEYKARESAYKERNWSCEVTGKGGMTYAEALAHEEEARKARTKSSEPNSKTKTKARESGKKARPRKDPVVAEAQKAAETDAAADVQFTPGGRPKKPRKGKVAKSLYVDPPTDDEEHDAFEPTTEMEKKPKAGRRAYGSGGGRTVVGDAEETLSDAEDRISRFTSGNKYPVFQVLRDAGTGGMTAMQIGEAIQERGLRDLSALKSVHHSMTSVLQYDNAFVRVGRGLWALRALVEGHGEGRPRTDAERGARKSEEGEEDPRRRAKLQQQRAKRHLAKHTALLQEARERLLAAGENETAKAEALKAVDEQKEQVAAWEKSLAEVEKELAEMRESAASRRKAERASDRRPRFPMDDLELHTLLTQRAKDAGQPGPPADLPLPELLPAEDQALLPGLLTLTSFLDDWTGMLEARKVPLTMAALEEAIRHGDDVGDGAGVRGRADAANRSMQAGRVFELLLENVLEDRVHGENAAECSRMEHRWYDMLDADGVWPEILRRFLLSGVCTVLPGRQILEAAAALGSSAPETLSAEARMALLVHLTDEIASGSQLRQHMDQRQAGREDACKDVRAVLRKLRKREGEIVKELRAAKDKQAAGGAPGPAQGAEGEIDALNQAEAQQQAVGDLKREREGLLAEIEAREADLERIQRDDKWDVRRECLGADRHHRRYWYGMGGRRDCVWFEQQRRAEAGAAEDGASRRRFMREVEPVWGVIEGSKAVEQVLGVVDDRGVRERELKKGLRGALERIKAEEDRMRMAREQKELEEQEACEAPKDESEEGMAVAFAPRKMLFEVRPPDIRLACGKARSTPDIRGALCNVPGVYTTEAIAADSALGTMRDLAGSLADAGAEVDSGWLTRLESIIETLGARNPTLERATFDVGAMRGETMALLVEAEGALMKMAEASERIKQNTGRILAAVAEETGATVEELNTAPEGAGAPEGGASAPEQEEGTPDKPAGGGDTDSDDEDGDVEMDGGAAEAGRQSPAQDGAAERQDEEPKPPSTPAGKSVLEGNRARILKKPKTWKAALFTVLSEAGPDGMDVEGIIAAVSERGLCAVGALKNPKSNINATLQGDAAFVRVGRGLWSVAGLPGVKAYAPTPQVAVPSTAAEEREEARRLYIESMGELAEGLFEHVDDDERVGVVSRRNRGRLWRSERERASWLQDVAGATTFARVAYCASALVWCAAPMLQNAAKRFAKLEQKRAAQEKISRRRAPKRYGEYDDDEEDGVRASDDLFAPNAEGVMEEGITGRKRMRVNYKV